MRQFVEWQRRSQPAWKRAVALAAAFLIFPTGIPWLLLAGLPALDPWARLGWGTAGLWLGWAGVVLGAPLALWTVATQLLRADGTPLPMMPTQRLLAGGPYGLCRNPMVLGTGMAYVGLALVSGSVVSLAAASGFFAGLLAYIRLVEEKELELRFGPAYLEYKRNTPFLLPRLRR